MTTQATLRRSADQDRLDANQQQNDTQGQQADGAQGYEQGAEAVRPAPEAAGAQPEAERTYTVRAGDSLSRIAANLLGDLSRWPEIQRLNGLGGTTINVGQTLRIPGGGQGGAAAAGAGAGAAIPTTTYVVKSGDSLYKIAAALLGDGSRWPEIQRASGLSGTALQVGQRLTVPAKEAAATPEVSTPGPQAAPEAAAPAPAPEAAAPEAAAPEAAAPREQEKPEEAAQEPDDPLKVSQGQLTFDTEGNDDPSSRFFSRRPHWPGTWSGVTIGRGYDMKERSQRDVLRHLQQAGLPDGEAQTLSGGAGLTKNAARDFANAHKNIVITREAQRSLFAVVYEDKENYAASCTKRWSGLDWGSLEQVSKDLLVDLFYRGDITSVKWRDNNMHAIFSTNNLGGIKGLLQNRGLWGNVDTNRYTQRVNYIQSAIAGDNQGAGQTTTSEQAPAEQTAAPAAAPTAAPAAANFNVEAAVAYNDRRGYTRAQWEVIQGIVGAGVDGDPGPDTARKVYAWQAANLSGPDGKVGPNTFSALVSASDGRLTQGPAAPSSQPQVDPNGGPPFGVRLVPSDEAAKYEYYKGALLNNGSTFSETPMDMNLMGVRGLADGVRVQNVKDQYNDTIIALWVDPDGGKHCREFKGSVDPGSFAKYYSTHGDANLVDGQYKYQFGMHQGKYKALTQGAEVDVWRDKDKDGTRENGEIQQRGYYGINIHAAGSGTRVGNWSAGCQVIWGGRGEGTPFNEFMDLMRQDPNSKFEYTLVDAAKLPSAAQA